jgi:transglutaminase-like putative cysteine protease
MDGPAQLWLPLAQSAGSYQKALSLSFDGNGESRVVQDHVYGAQALYVVWKRTGPREARVTQIVATRNRGPEPGIDAAERALYLRPTDLIPTDGIVRETAEKIIAGKTGAMDQIRALYDWVVERTFRDPKTRGCGLGDVKSMLESGYFGGKCADINSLFVGLARSLGHPARDVYGIRLAPSGQFRSLGATDDVSKAQHCRAEVYLDGAGWFPVDPADVRKAILEQEMPLDAPEIQALRNRLFGWWEMNWAGYNYATDIELPECKHSPDFLMYPCAETVRGQPDWLDPVRFAYRITSRELTES